MKKLVMSGPKQSKIVDTDMVQLRDENSVIVKIKYCGVCMSGSTRKKESHSVTKE